MCVYGSQKQNKRYGSNSGFSLMRVASGNLSVSTSLSGNNRKDAALGTLFNEQLKWTEEKKENHVKCLIYRCNYYF